MTKLEQTNPLLSQLKSGRLRPVQIGGHMVSVRFIDGMTGDSERYIGPIAYRTLFALAASSRYLSVQLKRGIHERHVPLYCANRPVPPLLLSFEAADKIDVIMLIWQFATFQTKLRCVFFPAGQVSEQHIQWPTHELILHLQAPVLARETIIDPGEFDLCDDLQVQLRNATGRLAGEGQWVEIDETEFRDRSAGQGVPLPQAFLDMLMTAIEDVLIPGDYISLIGGIEPPGSIALKAYLVAMMLVGGGQLRRRK